jgi:hypothetical protein
MKPRAANISILPSARCGPPNKRMHTIRNSAAPKLNLGGEKVTPCITAQQIDIERSNVS